MTWNSSAVRCDVVPLPLRGGRDLVGIFPQVVDQLGHARRLEIPGTDDQRVGHMRHHDDRLELARLKSKLGIEILVDHQRRRRRRRQ